MLEAGFRPQEKPDADTRFGPYWHRQYMFVAATMPSVTWSDAGSEIQKLYPEATWVATELLHQSKASLVHAWAQARAACSAQQQYLVRFSGVTATLSKKYVLFGARSTLSCILLHCFLWCRSDTLPSPGT